jgi:hypothetical protein
VLHCNENNTNLKKHNLNMPCFASDQVIIADLDGHLLYDILLESFWAVIAETAPVKEERRSQSHTSASLLHLFAM